MRNYFPAKISKPAYYQGCKKWLLLRMLFSLLQLHLRSHISPASYLLSHAIHYVFSFAFGPECCLLTFCHGASFSQIYTSNVFHMADVILETFKIAQKYSQIYLVEFLLCQNIVLYLCAIHLTTKLH
jgi:hypothetical protein